MIFAQIYTKSYIKYWISLRRANPGRWVGLHMDFKYIDFSNGYIWNYMDARNIKLVKNRVVCQKSDFPSLVV